MDWRKIFAITTIILLVVVVIESSMLISAPRVDPGEKKEVTIALQFADVVSLDPIKTTHGPDYYVIPHIYSCLLSVDPFRPAVLLPDLARDWTISPDGKSITFRLREGVQWHKGYGEVTAEDARFTYERLKDADSGSIFVDLYKVISKIEVNDRYTITFYFEEPRYGIERGNLMMFAQARSGSYIVSKEAVQKVGSKEYGADPIGSGPFVFDHYTPKQEVVLEANKDYFLGSPWLDRITYKMIEEEITRNVALENGEVDIQIALSEMEAIERFMQNPDIEVIRATSSLWAYGIAINVEMEPFTDLRVRKAIQYAIDVPAIIEALFGTEGRALPANSPFAPSAEGWNPGLKWHEHYERDLDKARSLLAEAGYPNGFSTTFVTHSFLQHEKIFTAIKDQLEDIDIDVTIEVVDVATWRAHMTAKDVAGIPIASNSRMLWSTFVYPDGPDAACKYSGCNELFQKAWVEPDPIKRSELYRSIQQKLLEDAPYIPLFYDYQMSAIRKGLRNFESPQFISDGFRLYWESSGD